MRVALLAVTDDVASASPAERHRRRGVAGDLVVFKVAGAAAEAGYDLDAVEAVASRANDRTRSFGAAFDGCTLPGAEAPLFSLPGGTIAWGLGVHGEPGIGESSLPSASELAAELVARVLSDAPAGGGSRVAVLLNGLGTVKYEELFVLWSSVLPLLEAAGLEVVAPEVGELVTSLDMAGCSLTVSWLDDELEELWLAPADSPAFRRTVPAPLDATPIPMGASLPAVSAATEAGQQAGVCVRQAVETVATLLHDLEDELGRLDAIAGDGDHGRGMARGSAAALAGATAAAEAGGDARTVLQYAGEEWADKAGGTSGALWGAGLLAAAERLPSDAVPSDADIVAAVVSAWEQVVAIGGAQVGDKTLIDALEPFAMTLRSRFDSGDDLETAWDAAVSAASSAAAATADIAARMGRSRVLGAKSLGTPDPGATSLAAVMGALTPVVTSRRAASFT
jgi:dihydroxyacetone kinase